MRFPVWGRVVWQGWGGDIIPSQWELFQDRSALVLFPREPLVLSVFLLTPDSQPPIIGKIVFPQIRIHCFVYL